MAIGQPAVADFCRRRGDTYPFTVTLQTSATPAVAIDITGFTFRLVVGVLENPDSFDDTPSFTNVPAVTDATNGVLTVTLSTQQADLAVGEYFYDLVQVDGSGFERTILSGKWDVE